MTRGPAPPNRSRSSDFSFAFRKAADEAMVNSMHVSVLHLCHAVFGGWGFDEMTVWISCEPFYWAVMDHFTNPPHTEHTTHSRNKFNLIVLRTVRHSQSVSLSLTWTAASLSRMVICSLASMECARDSDILNVHSHTFHMNSIIRLFTRNYQMQKIFLR